MDMVVEGRHALFFDDDATASFVNSREALVPWNSDDSLIIDRYDARHLLDKIPPRPIPGARRQRLLHDACDAVSLAEIDSERYQDLPPSGEGGEELDSETRKKSDDTGSGAYQAVPFSYGGKNTLDSHDNTEYSSCFCPPFEVPEFLLNHLPPTEKLHQIIARTAVFVIDHGRQSEIVLRVKQGDNPTFGFLMPDHHLHPYFQYLVDHPEVLKLSTDSPKEEEENLINHASEAGALSLLGSVYGNGDEDETTLKLEIKEKQPLNSFANATMESEQEEKSPLVGMENKDEIKLPYSAAAKEKKPFTINKVFSGNINSVATNRKVAEGHLLTAEKQQSFQENKIDLNPSIMEPPSILKRAIEKIVEFIVRNGKQLEAILINQDKNTGRFPFLLSTNQYHAYYLKMLEEAYELKLQGKHHIDHKSDEVHHGGIKKKTENHIKDAKTNDLDMAEYSEGSYYDPQRKDKFKMTLVGQKRDSEDHLSKAPKQSGLSADEAAAIVLAATRGASPANTIHKKSADDETRTSKNSGATAEEAAASVMAATRGWSPVNPPQNTLKDDGQTSSLGSLQGDKLISRFASSGLSGASVSTGLPGSVAAQSVKSNSHSTASDVAIATVIAKSVALVASREADSSEAGLTKEQKLKAERLKRAKMFAALIKNGSNCMGELATSDSNRHGSMEPPTGGSMQVGPDSYSLGLEREGSSAPDREYESRKILHSLSGGHHDGSDEDFKQSRKRQHSLRHNADKSYKASRSSFAVKEEVRHRHNHYSPSDDEHDEHRHRKSSEHRRRRHRDHCHSSDEDDTEFYKKRRRKHHSLAERKQEIEDQDTRKSLESSEGPSACNMPALDDKLPSSATEVSSDLRAKIRAMLLETL